MTLYHSSLADETTGTIVSLLFMWFLSNVANSAETKVLHKTTPISSITINVKLLFKMHGLYHTDIQNKTTKINLFGLFDHWGYYVLP